MASQPSARVSDGHACSLHGGAPVASGERSVIIGGHPAARVGDVAACSAPIAKGSRSVIIGGQMAARMGDPTGHAGAIVSGENTVVIGD